MKFTNRQKAECAKREVKQRKRVYAVRVAERKMSHEFAMEQTEMMQEIADEYDIKAQQDLLEERLL